MPVERVIHCDGPPHANGGEACEEEGRCLGHTSTLQADPYVPLGFVKWVEGDGNGTTTFWFCSFECAMRHAAQRPPSIVIPFHEFAGEDD